jgi:mono/diheme cytochrome c family protein
VLTPRFAPALLAVLACPTAGFAAPPDAVAHFEKKVRPLLAEKCLSCHGPAKQRGGLRLDSAEGLKKGGDSGRPLAVPGKPDESLLLLAVRHADGVEKMPPKGKLKDSEIADLAEWVKRGAPFPAAAEAVGPDPAKHWAFQPVRKPPTPAV